MDYEFQDTQDDADVDVTEVPINPLDNEEDEIEPLSKDDEENDDDEFEDDDDDEEEVAIEDEDDVS